jgi:16S rRNA (uracil1498-N3)-methyltransferase
MPDFRVHCRPDSTRPSELHLSPEESHHLIVVNRARAGDPVVAFDGEGTEWSCTVARAHKQHAVLAVASVRQAPPRPAEIVLAQALPKGPVMDAIVRKATELGAARIVPLESARTQVHLDADRSDRKLGRWQTAALEAAKQCGNPWLPTIEPVRPFGEFLVRAAAEPFDARLIASLDPGARPLRSVLAAGGRPLRRLVWLIGPEGDFAPEETRLAVEAGFAPVTLGSLVLRCDTAATYALSVTQHELQGG